VAPEILAQPNEQGNNDDFRFISGLITAMRIFEALFLLTVVLFTAAALVSDLRTRRIPNWLTAPALGMAIAMHTASGGISGLGFSLLGFAVGFGVLLCLWLIGGGGGGDVKMMGALGAWLGVTLTIQVFLVSTALTVLLAGVPLVYTFLTQGFTTLRRRYFAGSSRGGGAKPQSRTDCRPARRRLVPYAVPVALSTWMVLAAAWVCGTLP